MSSMISGKGTVHRAMGLRAAAFVMLLAMIAGCSGSDTATTAPATVSVACLSSTIGPAGCTLTGPDGVQVVVPAGALTQPTTIGIVRNPPVGAPAPLQEGNAPAGPVYEFTPHDLVFNVPVTIRMPVPANGVGAEVFMASLGADWQVNNATLVNGVAEWQRNSFSFGMAGLGCAPPVGDPYPCSYPSGGATVTAAPSTAITQIAPGWLNFGSGSAGSWRVNPPGGTVSVTLHYRVAPDCSEIGGSAPSGHVKLIRWNPAVSPHVVTTIRDIAVGLTVVPVTPPAGTFAYTGNGVPSSRGEGQTTVDVSSYLGDATNAFGFTFSCQRPGHPVHTGGDLITIIGPMAAPVGPFTIGGSVSGLTGTVVLRNNGGDDLFVSANGSFTFATRIAAGSSYTVTPSSQPTGQTCTVSAGSGLANADVSTVTVNCVTSGPVPLAATAIAAGFGSSLAVATDGTVWAWGNHVDPTTGGYKASSPFATVPVQVQGLTGAQAVAMSSEVASFYALHLDGTVSAWGLNNAGQLGDRTTTTHFAPSKVLEGPNTSMGGVSSIAASSNILLMNRASGPWIAGQFNGQSIGGGAPSGSVAQAVPGLPPGIAVSRISTLDAGLGISSSGAVLFTLADGRRFAWGSNNSNKLGAGTSTTFAGGVSGPADVSGFWSGTCCTEIGSTFAVALNSSTSALAAVGGNLNGELGNGGVGSSSGLIPVSVLANVSAFSVGQVSAAAITGGELWAWGWNGNIAVRLPTRVGTGTGFTQVSVGDNHSLAIGLNGEVYSWGDPSFGALGRIGGNSIPGVVMRP